MFFYCLQLNVSEFKIKFQQFLSIEPEVGVTNEYVMMMIVIDDFYLFHTLALQYFVNIRLLVERLAPKLDRNQISLFFPSPQSIFRYARYVGYFIGR